MTKTTIVLTGLLCAINFIGCSGGGKELPSGSVSGTVTYQGKPVVEGRVDFESDPPGYGAGATIKDGQFAIEGGVVLGKYKVAIIPPPPPPPQPGVAPTDTDPADIPEKYRSLTTSDLTAEIKDGKNELKFELK